jgi:hypothetical protein
MKVKDYFRSIKISAEMLAISISVISLLISAISFYISSLQPPKISFVTAPYIKHVVDNASLNEAFFIPITILNRGARSGTVLSFELTVTNVTSGETRTYHGQYFTQEGSQTTLGDFFTPISLNGFSSTSYTVCFYPIGTVAGNIFSQAGVYQFEVIAGILNTKNEIQQSTANTFQVTLDQNMESVILEQPDGEYIYPLPIENLQ